MPPPEEVDSKDAQQLKPKKKISSGKSVYKSISADLPKDKSVYKSPDVSRELRTKRSNETVTKEATRDTTEEEGGARKKNSGEKEKNSGEKEKNSGEKGGVVVRKKSSKEDVGLKKKEEGVVVVRKRASKDSLVPKSRNSSHGGAVRRRSSNASSMSKYSTMTFMPPSKFTIQPDKPKLEESNHDAIREKSGQPASSDSTDFLVSSIPKTFFHSVDVSFDLEYPIKADDMVFSHSMVVRSVNRNSPLFNYLVVGDQVVDVNDTAVICLADFVKCVNGNSTPCRCKLKIIRAWNVHHCGDRLPTKTRKDSYYSVIDVYKMSGMKNGFELRLKNKKGEVTTATPKSRGGHAFLKNDRILDVDSHNVSPMQIKDIRRLFNSVLESRGKCSFLVERDLTLRTSPNPSLCVSRGASANLETSLRDEACEIGSREATRFQQTKSNPPKVSSILKEVPKNAGAAVASAVDEVDQSSPSRKSKRRKRVSMDGGKNELSKTPSDVKDPSVLQKVTAKSGIVAFIRNVLSK